MDSQEKENYRSKEFVISRNSGHVHSMKLSEPWFGLMSAGMKDVEIRVYDAKRREIRVGDTLIFRSMDTDNVVIRNVAEILEFEDFREALEKVGVSRALPRKASTLEKGVQIYHDIPGYREKAQL